MRFLIFAILLAFPFMEIAVMIELGQRYGWWLLLYLLTIAYLGLQLIRSEKNLIAARMFQQMSAGGNPLAAMLSTARNLFAGILLMIPGVISDVIAVILLLLPTAASPAPSTQSDRKFYGQTSANDEVIEGEFTEVKDQKPLESVKNNVIQLPSRKDS